MCPEMCYEVDHADTAAAVHRKGLLRVRKRAGGHARDGLSIMDKHIHLRRLKSEQAATIEQRQAAFRVQCMGWHCVACPQWHL